MTHREFDLPADASRDVPAVRLDEGESCAVLERVAEEAPVALVYNGVSHVVVLATPLDLEDLALGFSLSEGLIGSASELQGIEIVPEQNGCSAYLSVPRERVEALDQRRRNIAARTGCGLCGAETIAQAIRAVPQIAPGAKVPAQAIARAMAQLPSKQSLNAQTGAVHAAGWSNLEGELQLVREDVGRHNALDKLIGALAGGGVDTAQGFVVVTSRASYEMVQKSAMAGIGLLAAVSAPTALAVRIAKEAGVAVAGFARGGRCVVYADTASRITTKGDWQA